MGDLNPAIYVVPLGMLLCSLTVSWFTYPCNAYGNVKWNSTDKSEVRLKYLPIFRDPYKVKCTENCDHYKRRIELILKRASFEELSFLETIAVPNPFCFDWDEEYDNFDKNSNHQKFTSKFEKSSDGNWRNKMSISFSVATILLLSGQASMNEDLSATDIWFSICVFTTILSHLGTLYYGITAFSYLSCQERFAVHDTFTGKFKEFKYQHSCDNERTVQQGNTHGGARNLDQIGQLPGIPMDWTIYKWNLVINYLIIIPLVAAAIYNLWRRRENALQTKRKQSVDNIKE